MGAAGIDWCINSPSNANMCLRRLNAPRLSVLIPSTTSAVPPKADPNSPKQVKTNSSRLTEELHERFSITTIDGTSAMFIFHALVLSLTRPNFFSRAIIEPRVQTPLPAPPDKTHWKLKSIVPEFIPATNRWQRAGETLGSRLGRRCLVLFGVKPLTRNFEHRALKTYFRGASQNKAHEN